MLKGNRILIVVGILIALASLGSAYPTFSDFGVDISLDDIIGDRPPMVMAEDETPPQVPQMLDLSVDMGTTVMLDGSGATDDVGIELDAWTFKDHYEDVRLDGMMQSHKFDIPGVDQINLEVTDEAGNSASSAFDLTARDTEPPVASIDTWSTVIWSGETAGWRADISTDNVGIVRYTWTFEYDGRTVNLDGNAPGFVFEKAGDYEITLIVEDAAGNTDSASMDLTVQNSIWQWMQSVIVIVAVALVTIFVMRRLGYGKGGEDEEPEGEEDAGPVEEEGSEEAEEVPEEDEEIEEAKGREEEDTPRD